MKYILLPFTAVYRVICAIFSAPQKLFGKAEDKVIDAQEQNRIKKTTRNTTVKFNKYQCCSNWCTSCTK